MFNVCPVKNWPQEKPEKYTVRYEAHPFIKWLSKYIPIEPWVDAEFTRYVDNDPLMVDNAVLSFGVRSGKTLYCSYAQYEGIKKEMAQKAAPSQGVVTGFTLS